MKSILNSEDRDAIYTRLDRLIPDGERQWGKMSKEQTICHMTDQLRLISGDVVTVFEGNLFTRTILKRIVLMGIPAPPEKISTFELLDFDKGGGTPPTSMTADLNLLKAFIEEFVSGDKRYEPPQSHSLFGPMSRDHWGRMVYVHMNHHLKQFNV